MRRTNKATKKGRFMKGTIIGVFSFLLVFTVAVLIVFVATGGMEPSTLIVSVFGVCGFECGILGWIKTSKEKETELKERKAAERKIQNDNSQNDNSDGEGKL